MMDRKEQLRLRVEGIVQGVGFRPFLHRLAERFCITGWVQNTSAGLEGILEGTKDALSAFLLELETSPPPMAQIDSVVAAPLTSDDNISGTPDGGVSENAAPAGMQDSYFKRFTIRESRIRPGATLISPDIAMCPECEAELYSPGDRRYRYPFINCTNCGPRYTITEALPYDRERTVMREFDMCPDCAREYGDIADRRYHAQPDCCPACGPDVFYRDSLGRMESGDTSRDAFRRAQRLLADGGILAVKGIGGVHLACDALNPDAVRRLRERKHRPHKPLALMCRSLEAARRIADITPAEEELLLSPSRPIVLLAKKDRENKVLRELSFSPRIGVMLPYSPLHSLLLDGAPGAPDILVMTSGNIPGCPVLTENEESLSALRTVADGFLLHDRRIANRCDDSLVYEWQGQPCFLRRSRGYAPRPLTLDRADGIFAFGAEQKASFALGRDSHVFLSPYIGDLKNAETFAHYTQAMETYERLFSLRPSQYVCDLHPDYLSTQEAQRRAFADGIPLLRVQHHWAHMASCMADNRLDTPCFGIVWDGTGLGTDGTVWGGEFLTGDYHDFKRSGSIRPIALPGGDRAVREIGRIALSLVLDAGEGTFADVPLPEEKCRMLAALLPGSGALSHADASSTSRPAVSVPAASSIGRLFDGVCALLLGQSEVSCEGEGAARLEALSPMETPQQPVLSLRELSYPAAFYMEDGVRLFDTRPMIRALLKDIRNHTGKGATALRFMSTLVCMAADQCRTLNPGRLPVILSGGVFQNRFLLHGVTAMLEELGYTVYTHHQVSANDEGVCLGQLAIARAHRVCADIGQIHSEKPSKQ